MQTRPKVTSIKVNCKDLVLFGVSHNLPKLVMLNFNVPICMYLLVSLPAHNIKRIKSNCYTQLSYCHHCRFSWASASLSCGHLKQQTNENPGTGNFWLTSKAETWMGAGNGIVSQLQYRTSNFKNNFTRLNPKLIKTILEKKPKFHSTWLPRNNITYFQKIKSVLYKMKNYKV